jgi:hypothetical protein
MSHPHNKKCPQKSLEIQILMRMLFSNFVFPLRLTGVYVAFILHDICEILLYHSMQIISEECYVELLLFLGDLERGGQRSRRTYGGC